MDGQLLSAIEGQIDQLARDYAAVPGLILTEDDLKCLLHSRLSGMSDLSGDFETRDPGIRATRVHSEVSWFDAQGKLTIKPDLTVLDPANLRILEGDSRGARLPSKCFEFSGDAVVLELKFIRHKAGVTEHLFRTQILRDWEKVQRLFARLDSQGPPDSMFCFFVIFNKGTATCREFEQFLSANASSFRHKVMYRSGGVFPGGPAAAPAPSRPNRLPASSR